VTEKKIDLEDLVGSVEIAQRMGVKDHNVVNTWRRRHPDFPGPILTLRLGRIWSWSEVERWARATGRQIRPRSPQPEG
jgi:hypothetical protein